MSKKAALNGMDYIGSYLVVVLCPYPEIINLIKTNKSLGIFRKFVSIKSM